MLPIIIKILLSRFPLPFIHPGSWICYRADYCFTSDSDTGYTNNCLGVASNFTLQVHYKIIKNNSYRIFQMHNIGWLFFPDNGYEMRGSSGKKRFSKGLPCCPVKYTSFFAGIIIYKFVNYLYGLVLILLKCFWRQCTTSTPVFTCIVLFCFYHGISNNRTSSSIVMRGSDRKQQKQQQSYICIKVMKT